MYRTKYSTGTKYNNQKAHGWDSKFEMNVGNDFELRKEAGEIADYKRQVSIPLKVNGFLISTYKIDFVIEHLDGHNEYIEAKGFATRDWQLTWKLFEALSQDLDPGCELTIIYQKKMWTPRGSTSNIYRR